MSTVIFFGVLVLLTLGIWLVAIISLWYGRELLKRQRTLTMMLLPYIQKMEHDKKMMKNLNIGKGEPLSKYEAVTLPDEININFTEEK